MSGRDPIEVFVEPAPDCDHDCQHRSHLPAAAQPECPEQYRPEQIVVLFDRERPEVPGVPALLNRHHDVVPEEEDRPGELPQVQRHQMQNEASQGQHSKEQIRRRQNPEDTPDIEVGPSDAAGIALVPREF